MPRRKKKVNIKTKGDDAFLTGSLLSDFELLDPIAFVEKTLTIDGKPFRLNDCGRDYLHEIYRYICLQAVGDKGKPVVVKKGRQVEMTTTACAVSLYMACSGAYDHIRGLHTFPQIEQARRYSKVVFSPRIKESINGCLFTMLENDGSVTQKPFKQGNFILIEGAGDAGDRLRGLPLDYALFDEIQDLARQARENTQEALSHSKFGPPGFGMELDFGTPKDENSDFHDLWLASDRRFYHLKCIHCGHFFPLFYDYTPQKEVTDTNLTEGRMCECRDRSGKGCGKVMDKRQAVKGGKWIATGDKLGNIDTATRRGYHIDQLLIPDITREAIDEKLQTRTARAFANEVAGDFYAGRDTGPSFKEVLEATTLDPDTREWRFSVQVPDKMTWAGIDWGQRLSGEDDEGSGGYTVFTVISRMPHGKFRLEFTHRMDQRLVTGDTGQLAEMMSWIRHYNCKVVACDFGAGYVQNQVLKEKFPDRVMEIVSSANCRDTYKLDKTKKQITIDKHRVFEEVYDEMMDRGSFCFPYKEPQKVEWLMQHIANVEIVSSISNSGQIKKQYIKQGPTKPIDGACALIYAYTAYKFQKTSGFSSLHSPTYQGNRSMPLPGGGAMRPMARMGAGNRGR